MKKEKRNMLYIMAISLLFLIMIGSYSISEKNNEMKNLEKSIVLIEGLEANTARIKNGNNARLKEYIPITEIKSIEQGRKIYYLWEGKYYPAFIIKEVNGDKFSIMNLSTNKRQKVSIDKFINYNGESKYYKYFFSIE